jgi:bacterioferritin (cytochrome b1)
MEKLLKKLGKILDQDLEKQKEKRDKLRKLLKKLRQHSEYLKKEIEKTQDQEKLNQLEQELKILQVQRKKAVALCKEINCKK